MRFLALVLCFFISAAVMALPPSHVGEDGQLNNSKTRMRLKARSQADPGGEGHNIQQDWTSHLYGQEQDTYETLKETHDRWQRTNHELWGSFQECQNQVQRDHARIFRYLQNPKLIS